VASLPDEQVVPPAPNVSKGPWRKSK